MGSITLKGLFAKEQHSLKAVRALQQLPVHIFDFGLSCKPVLVSYFVVHCEGAHSTHWDVQLGGRWVTQT